eukprot:GFUD01022744.1.p1 GENE.GFUD01022744.1~~GFUD01022744.1.p1  ORF type:complete len:163 (-),score=26.02 GFUD01022744.1:166-654(-)
MQELSVCASLRLCLWSVLIYEVSSQPGIHYTSCGCLEQSDTISLTDTRQLFLSALQCCSVCTQLGAQLFTFGIQEGSCLCGNRSKQTVLCHETEKEEGNRLLLEVFCVHNKEDLFFGVEEDGVEKVNEDTWVLAIILFCFCLLCLLVAWVMAASPCLDSFII